MPARRVQQDHADRGWVTWGAAWAAGLAFVISGAILCWAYFGGHGSQRATKALGGACVGSIIISAGSTLANALLV